MANSKGGTILYQP